MDRAMHDQMPDARCSTRRVNCGLAAAPQNAAHRLRKSDAALTPRRKESTKATGRGLGAGGMGISPATEYGACTCPHSARYDESRGKRWIRAGDKIPSRDALPHQQVHPLRTDVCGENIPLHYTYSEILFYAGRDLRK
ncbi:hypothetical protein V9T40_013124 [Parthenolecanium corni]|uniref:Uncharacterized protein n=1 Tax=Parthenolecanium corni TaxID=536013 RepID=A0AAN9TWN6_9HEMI